MSEDKNFNEALNKAEELEHMDFANGVDFNIGEYYSALEKIAKKNTTLKNEEAEEIVTNQAKEEIDADFIEELEAKRKSVEEFIRKYDPNKPETQALEIYDVDKVYAVSNYLLNSYIQYVNEMKFVFQLSKLEYKFLNKILLNEIEYNGDEVFNFAEFHNTFWKGVQEKVEEDKSVESFTFSIEIKTILILHHLIKGHTVKGRTNDFNLFQSVLFKIAKINKLFNAYNIIIERIKSDREMWGAGLDEIMKTKDPEYLAQVEAAKEKALGVPGGFQNAVVTEVTPEDLGEK